MFVRIDSVWKWVWQGPSSIWQRRAGVELEDSWRFPSFSRLFVVLLLLFHTWSEENYRTIKLLSPPPFLPTTNIIKKFVCMSESRITTEFPHSSSLGLFDESIYFSPLKCLIFKFFSNVCIFAPKMDKSAYPTLCRLLFAIVAKWSINAHLGKWWEENNDDFLLANVSTHVRKEGKKLGKKQVEGIWYHGIQRTFDFYAVVSNACKYDRSSRRKKIYFLSFFFHPYFSSVKERCQYSTCIQFPGSNVPIRARKRFCQESKKSHASVMEWTCTWFSPLLKN